MSSKQWAGLAADAGWMHRQEGDTGRSRTQIRADRRGEADGDGWSEDLETAVYGEEGWILPGTGDEGSECGVWYPEAFCDSDAGHVHMGMHHCGNRECPRCWSGWSRDLAVAGCVRLGARRLSAPEGEKRAIHGYVSPPEGTIQSRQEMYTGMKEAYRMAQQKGVRGGVLIPHGYRIKSDVKDVIEAERELDKFSGGDWKWVRESDRHWRDLTYWSPHYHVIGWVGSNDVAAGDTEADDGWLWQNKRSLKPFNLTREEGYDDQIGLMRYLLSHVTIEEGEGRQAVRWFGDLAPAAFSPEEELSEGRHAALVRMAEEVAGGTYDREDDESDPDADEEDEPCRVEGCDGNEHPIWHAGEYLDQRGDQLPERTRKRIHVALEWARGDVEPPPGMKRPTTEQQGREAFEQLLR